MSVDRERLAELVERVRGATGPDRELDAALADLTGDEKTASGWVHAASSTRLQVAKPYTASIDAALGLVERLLPGWVIDHIGQDAIGSLGKMKPAGWTVEISDGFNRPHQGQAPTLPLAILTALLLSLELSNDHH